MGRCDGKEELCQKINRWVKENTNWVRKQLAVLRYKLSDSLSIIDCIVSLLGGKMSTGTRWVCSMTRSRGSTWATRLL